ncbi:MAG TPA: alpha/beta hydrolase [Candidatus Rubrimentiphilum sp.]|nr:alpha/beta hydrolase [Candidatus Rubrimentiphilum sp.]
MTNGSGLHEMLCAFRQTHTVRTDVIAGHTWDAIECGSGESTVVLLPGGGTSAESEFPLIAALEPHARVLSVGCPSTVRTVREAIDGLKALLDRYGVQTCFLLGHSLGGILAQCFALTFPERVDGLILANVANYSRWRGKLIKAIVSSARYLPRKAVVGLLSARINSLLKGHADREFWLAYFTEGELARVGSEGIVNRGACVDDAIEHWSSAAKPMKPWDGPILILESDNETGFTSAERKAFRDHYAHAKVHTLYGAGHLSNLTRMEEFNAAVLDFIRRRGGQKAHSA